jgi:hypothetical protein
MGDEKRFKPERERIAVPAEKIRNARCENCQHFDPGTAPGSSSCRASYPATIPLMGQHGFTGAVGIWPPVRPSNWCSKHEVSQPGQWASDA